MQLRVVIFDDHSFVTQAIKSFFVDKVDILVLGTYTDKDSLLQAIKDFEYVNILITDVLTDEDIGLVIFEEIRSKYPHIKIIVYSSIKSDFLVSSLYELGVSSIIHKKEPIDKIYEQIIKLNLSYSKNSNTVVLPKLTEKEKQIVKYLAEGLVSKEIADKTNSSVNTINNQKNALLEKYKCNNSTELIVKLNQLGILSII